VNTLRLSLRNSGRNVQRTLVTTLSMAFACFIMILFSSIMAGFLHGSERQVVEMNMGDIQIHARGYLDDPDIYTTLSDGEAILQQLDRLGLQAAPRLYGGGLLAANMASAGVQLRGVDLAREAKVTQLSQHMGQGEWLDGKDLHHVVLGKKLAGTLGVAVGDELVFVGQSADGFMANDMYEVRGILKAVADGIDRSAMYMPEASFRQLMAMPRGTHAGVHEVVVRRAHPNDDLNALTDQLQARFPNDEVKNWRQLMPVIATMLEGADAQMMVMLMITYIAVASIILNAMLMTVFERMHEFGIMKAVGVSPWQIVRLIYAETLIQVVAASLLALMLGWWGAHYLELHGIDMSSFNSGSISFSDIAFDPIWYAYVTPQAFYMPTLFLLLMAMLAVIYPAAKAALIRPIDAIYYR